MIELVLFIVGVAAGLLVARAFSPSAPKDPPTVCIKNCFDGERNHELRAVCRTSQSDKCFKVLDRRCDQLPPKEPQPDPVPQ